MVLFKQIDQCKHTFPTLVKSECLLNDPVEIQFEFSVLILQLKL